MYVKCGIYLTVNCRSNCWVNTHMTSKDVCVGHVVKLQDKRTLIE